MQDHLAAVSISRLAEIRQGDTIALVSVIQLRSIPSAPRQWPEMRMQQSRFNLCSKKYSLVSNQVITLNRKNCSMSSPYLSSFRSCLSGPTLIATASEKSAKF
ncbi:uncharacterized protein VTP21DRAFT_9657 [Calcarisporiella thermophila]|uniref:uncharacterized protein n=1 Tax=Calcarisporiella thermophila TaxID=911321 RepID=UPI003743F5BB